MVSRKARPTVRANTTCCSGASDSALASTFVSNRARATLTRQLAARYSATFWAIADTRRDSIELLPLITQSPVVHNGKSYVGVSSAVETVAAVVPGYRCCSSRGSMLSLDLKTGKAPMEDVPGPRGRTAGLHGRRDLGRHAGHPAKRAACSGR